MKTIFIVTQGNYSDYSIEAIFDDKTLAEEFIKRYSDGSDDYMIEPWILNDAVKVLREGYDYWSITMDRDGSVEKAEMRNDYPGNDYNTDMPWNKEGRTQLSVIICAQDSKHAIKIVNEKRAQIIASNEWRPDKVEGKVTPSIKPEHFKGSGIYIRLHGGEYRFGNKNTMHTDLTRKGDSILSWGYLDVMDDYIKIYDYNGEYKQDLDELLVIFDRPLAKE